jgi:hypothetical protein
MLLDNPAMMERYAQGIYQLHRRWSDHAVNQRRMAIESLLSDIAGAANLPMPTIVWIPEGSSWFRIGPWEIHASLIAVQMNQITDFKDWLHKITSPYHELRHADQHRVMLEAFMNRALPLPVLFSAGLMARDGHLPRTIEEEGYPYPQHIVTRIRMQRLEFQQSWLPQARAWSDSFYGRFSIARQQTMNTLAQQGKGIHYGAYRALAEEADAFAVQTQVKRRIKELLRPADEPFDISELFG